jgi:crotonobetaine/carnitine-CoA ligase
MSSDTTLAERLARHAAATPHKIALRCDADVLSYRELDELVARMAHGLRGYGVRAGDPVCVLLETSCDYVVAWLALCRIGALEVPINTGFRGAALEHALRLTSARMLILDAEHVPAVSAVRGNVPQLQHIVLRGERKAGDALRDVTITSFEELLAARADTPPLRGRPGDATMLLFTSGSTGPSKACAIPHRYTLRQPEIFCEQLRMTAADVLYAPFPLFHADGAIFTLAAALACGGTAALARKFSVSRFWEDCRRHGATVFDYMGATLALLHKQPAAPSDREHGVRLGWGVPSPPFAAEFEQRFGLELVELYGSSDAGIVLYNRPGEPRKAGSCGRPIPSFDLRLRGEDGRDVGIGQVGELVVRANEPHLIMNEYYGDAAATKQAFRDGWFHTGDLLRRDADGHHYFVSRLKDLIRRRGENISAFDVEQALLLHPDVVEVAAYGVPSELTEEDVMVCVVARSGSSLTAQDVLQWAAQRLARHMCPRYVELADALPRTPTEKTAKHVLKARGVTANTVEVRLP